MAQSFAHGAYMPSRLTNIRRADRGDAKRLSAIAEETFRATFSALNTPEDIDLHCRNTYSEEIQASEIADPDTVTLIGEQDEMLVGYAQLRWRKAPSCVVAEAPGEIQRLYVVSDAHGKGVAHDLMSACIDEMTRRRSDVAWLGVWEQNPRAIAFYRKFGFVEVGEHVFLLGRDRQRDIVLARPVRRS
jgi:ribosomal protein S18 acetylase RimI-like enzyme